MNMPRWFLTVSRRRLRRLSIRFSPDARYFTMLAFLGHSIERTEIPLPILRLNLCREARGDTGIFRRQRCMQGHLDFRLPGRRGNFTWIGAIFRLFVISRLCSMNVSGLLPMEADARSGTSFIRMGRSAGIRMS